MIIYSLDKYDPINLDIFNADVSTVGKQPVFSSFSSLSKIILIVPSLTAAVTLSGFTPHAVSRNYLQEQEIARYHLIFGYYPVTLLSPQVPHTNSSSTIPTLPPMPRLTSDHRIETLPTSLLFCLTLPPIQINSLIPILVPSKVETLTDGQPTNLLPVAIPGI